MASQNQAQQLPKVKLYWLNQSRSQRILWLLEELGLPYELEILHRKSDQQAPSELLKAHPLGKSPIITVTPPPLPAGSGDGAEAEAPAPVTLAESGFIVQYLTEGTPGGERLIPKRWRDGCEGRMGGETEAWMRHQYYLHYCEGSLMALLVTSIFIGALRSTKVPFLIRPITSIVANQIFSSFIFPNMRRHLQMIEGHLETAGDGGGYLCGASLTSADILVSFPFIAGREQLNTYGAWEGGSWGAEFPRVYAWSEKMEQEEGYKRSVAKIIEVDGKFESSF